jgi:hypothetical protein
MRENAMAVLRTAKRNDNLKKDLVSVKVAPATYKIVPKAKLEKYPERYKYRDWGEFGFQV